MNDGEPPFGIHRILFFVKVQLVFLLKLFILFLLLFYKKVSLLNDSLKTRIR
ncbi:hypothetical protein BB14905_12255 [Bacillus sp. B14905]|nr:hypothetical protein BB14905_12255 [Bacillus sp. B14905]